MAGTFELISTIDNAITATVPLPTGGVTAGEVLAYGSDGLYGFAAATVAESTTANAGTSLDPDDYTIIVEAQEVDANKDGNAINRGDLVYWSGTAATASSTGNTLIGYCVKSAGASATRVRIRFRGGASVSV